jgi:hypothetical protein
MDKKRLQQLRNMAKEAFQSTGTPIDEVALDFASTMADDPRFQQLIDRPEQVASAAVVAGCLQAASTYTDVPEEQWRGFLEKMKQELLSGLRPKFRKGMNAVAKGLPKRPSTGRREILESLQKKKKACNLVSKYYQLGYSRSVAYDKAAREMNCSRRTIQRVWQDRAKLYRKV